MKDSNQKLRKGAPARYKENIFQYDDIWALEEVSQSYCQVAKVFKTQLNKAVGSLAWIQCWPGFEEGVALGDLQRSIPSWLSLWFDLQLTLALNMTTF